MPLVEAEALESIKARLSILEAGSDSLLTAMIADNVKRLFPRLQVELDSVDVTLTFSNYFASLDLSELSFSGVRQANIVTTDGEFPADGIYQHAAKLRIAANNCTGATTVRLYPLTRPTLENLDDEYHLGLIYYVMSDYYASQVGLKRQYNQYMENGAPATDEMADLSEFWEKKAIKYIDDRAPLYGHQ